MEFERIVQGLELEPMAVAVVRECLKEDRDPAEYELVDGLVDELRVLWGWSVFDRFCQENIEGQPRAW